MPTENQSNTVLAPRPGKEFWDKLNALPRYMFLLKPSDAGIQKLEDRTGNRIDVHEAQKVVDQAQDRISELRDELGAAKGEYDRSVNKLDALQQRLIAVDQRINELTQQLAIESAIKEPAGEDVLWQVLDAAVGVLTRRAAPHAWESEAHQAGMKIILARREGLTVAAIKPTESATCAKSQTEALREELTKKDAAFEDLLQSNSDMTTCLTAAEQRNAELKRDTARIDWLIDQPVDTLYLDDGRIIDIAGRIDLRDAIDEAMAKPTESGASE